MTADGGVAAGVGPYLRRIGLSPAADPAVADVPAEVVDAASDREALARLQAAHLRSVPFETLSITGPPDSDATGPGVALELGHLYGKVVERGRGGFCFELNGLFGWLLSALGFETDRVAGMVLPDEGAPTPANHHATVVALDRRYVVDVGTGVPVPWRPVPLDGTAVTDERGTAWRVVTSSRPNAVVLAGDPGTPPTFITAPRPPSAWHCRTSSPTRWPSSPAARAATVDRSRRRSPSRGRTS